MSFTINYKKVLILSLVLLMVWSNLSSLSVTAESGQANVSQVNKTPRFSDVSDSAWYAETVNIWIALGILKPTEGDKLNPQVDMTRGGFVQYLAIALDLTPSKSSSTFKDLTTGDELTGYVTALKEMGLVDGYTDGTFRPNANITRAEVASIIVRAKKLMVEPEMASQFLDVKKGSWYAGPIGALKSAGIAIGKTKDKFDPNANVTIAEGITFLNRAFYTLATIQDINSDGSVKINGQTYKVGKSVAGILRYTNKEALINAGIRYTINAGTIESIEELTIGYKALNNENNEPILFDGEGNTINGSLIIDADNVMLSRLKIKENLILAPSIQNNFFAYSVLVNGSTTFLKDFERPAALITNIWYDNSDLGEIHLFNSAHVNKIDMSTLTITGGVSSTEPLHSIASLGYMDLLSVSTASSYTFDIQKLYVAYFGRPADPSGLAYWSNVVENRGGNIEVITQQFAASPEYTSLYSGISNSELIISIYQNLFGRAPDSQQLASWVTLMNSGVTSNNLIEKMMALDLFIEGVLQPDIKISGYASLSAGPDTVITSLSIAPGANVELTSETPIDELIIGSQEPSGVEIPTGGTSFTGVTDIVQVQILAVEGEVNLDVDGSIEEIKITTDIPLLNLSPKTYVEELTVPPGISPSKLFPHNYDLSSRIKSVNGQSTTSSSSSDSDQNTNPNPNPNQGQDPNQSPNPNLGPNQ